MKNKPFVLVLAIFCHNQSCCTDASVPTQEVGGAQAQALDHSEVYQSTLSPQGGGCRNLASYDLTTLTGRRLATLCAASIEFMPQDYACLMDVSGATPGAPAWFCTCRGANCFNWYSQGTSTAHPELLSFYATRAASRNAAIGDPTTQHHSTWTILGAANCGANCAIGSKSASSFGFSPQPGGTATPIAYFHPTPHAPIDEKVIIGANRLQTTLTVTEHLP